MHAESTGELHARSLHTSYVTWQLKAIKWVKNNLVLATISNLTIAAMQNLLKYQVKKYQNNFAGFSQENPNIYLFRGRKLKFNIIPNSFY